MTNLNSTSVLSKQSKSQVSLRLKTKDDTESLVYSELEDPSAPDGKSTRYVIIKDPITKKTIVKLRNPQHTISGYTGDLSGTIDL